MAALDLLRDGLRPCLTILDLMMPRMNGWELRESMLADPDLADLPVAVVSALAVAEMRQLRLAGVISKPFQLEEIVQLAERHCDPSPTGRSVEVERREVAGGVAIAADPGISIQGRRLAVRPQLAAADGAGLQRLEEFVVDRLHRSGMH